MATGMWRRLISIAVGVSVAAGWGIGASAWFSGGDGSELIEQAVTIAPPPARWAVAPAQRYTGQFVLQVAAFDPSGIRTVSVTIVDSAGRHHTLTRSTMTIVPAKYPLGPSSRYALYEFSFDARWFAPGRATAMFNVYTNAGTTRNSAFQDPGPMPLYLDPNNQHPVTSALVSPSGNDPSTDSGRIWQVLARQPFRNVNAALRAIQAFNRVTYVHVGGVPGPMDRLDYAIVELMPGEYNWTGEDSLGYLNSAYGWVTLKPASGVRREQVRFVSTQQPSRVQWLKIEGVELVPPPAPPGDFRKFVTTMVTVNDGIGGSRNTRPKLWIDRVAMRGPGRELSVVAVHAADWGGVWATGCEYYDLSNAAVGYELVRDCYAERIGSDLWSMSHLVLNCLSFRLDKGLNTAAHSDVFQYRGSALPQQNFIVYNVAAFECVTGQLIFVVDDLPLESIAIVNFLAESTSTGLQKSQWAVPSNNALLANITLVNQDFIFPRAGSTPLFFHMRSAAVERMLDPGRIIPGMLASGSSIRRTHHRMGGLMPGSDATSGEAGFIMDRDPDAYTTPRFRYVPDTGSILRNRTTNTTTDRVTPLDVFGQAWPTNESWPVGAVAPTSTAPRRVFTR